MNYLGNEPSSSTHFPAWPAGESFPCTNPTWCTPIAPLPVEYSEEEEEREEEHPQHGRDGEEAGGVRGYARPRGPQHPVPLGEDGSPGPAPPPRPRQPKLVGGAGPEEDLQGQPWVCHQELEHVGLRADG